MKLFSIAVIALTFGAVCGCKKWCFTSTRCLVPDQSDCVKCVKFTCYNYFARPFQNFFGAECVEHAMSSCCNAVCGYPDYHVLRWKRVSCTKCLEPCIAEAQEERQYCFPPPPPPDAPIEGPPGFPVCDECTECLNRTEVYQMSEFCTGFMYLSCSHLASSPEAFWEMMDRLARKVGDISDHKGSLELPMDLVECVADAWDSPCSQCPDIPRSRVINCAACLNPCYEKVECTLGCSREVNGPHSYPMVVPCEPCVALCKVTEPDRIDGCIAERCPSCMACDACYNGCAANPGIIKNTCRCKLGGRQYIDLPGP